MEVVPVHNQHPSCLHPLSRGEGMGFIWMLNNCYCFTSGGSTHSFDRNRPPSPLTKGQIFDPICFCYLVLGPHSSEFNFYIIYDEPSLLFSDTRLQLRSDRVSLLFDGLSVTTFVCLACADGQFSNASPVLDVTNTLMVLLCPICHITAVRKKSTL